MEKLNIEETGARGCAQKLQRGNFGIIESIEELEDDGRSLGMYLNDENGKRFYITMDDKGYVGYIQDETGEYVYAPVD